MSKSVVIIVIIIIWILIIIGICVGLWLRYRSENIPVPAPTSGPQPIPSSNPTPSNPTPSNPTPSNPTPSNPTPSNPTPSNPSPSPNPPPPTPNMPPINYLQTVQLFNQNGSGYALSTCNDGTCSNLNVTLRTDSNYDSQAWTIVNGSDVTSNGPVLYGDSNVILLLVNTSSTALGVCGITTDGCEFNVVAGVNNPTPATTTWTITNANGAAIGSNVNMNDMIYLQTNLNNNYLTACGNYNAGGTCGSNVAISASSPTTNSSMWQIL